MVSNIPQVSFMSDASKLQGAAKQGRTIQVRSAQTGQERTMQSTRYGAPSYSPPPPPPAPFRPLPPSASAFLAGPSSVEDLLFEVISDYNFVNRVAGAHRAGGRSLGDLEQRNRPRLVRFQIPDFVNDRATGLDPRLLALFIPQEVYSPNNRIDKVYAAADKVNAEPHEAAYWGGGLAVSVTRLPHPHLSYDMFPLENLNIFPTTSEGGVFEPVEFKADMLLTMVPVTIEKVLRHPEQFHALESALVHVEQAFKANAEDIHHARTEQEFLKLFTQGERALLRILPALRHCKAQTLAVVEEIAAPFVGRGSPIPSLKDLRDEWGVKMAVEPVLPVERVERAKALIAAEGITLAPVPALPISADGRIDLENIGIMGALANIPTEESINQAQAFAEELKRAIEANELALKIAIPDMTKGEMAEVMGLDKRAVALAEYIQSETITHGTVARRSKALQAKLQAMEGKLVTQFQRFANVPHKIPQQKALMSLGLPNAEIVGEGENKAILFTSPEQLTVGTSSKVKRLTQEEINRQIAEVSSSNQGTALAVFDPGASTALSLFEPNRPAGTSIALNSPQINAIAREVALRLVAPNKAVPWTGLRLTGAPLDPANPDQALQVWRIENPKGSGEGVRAFILGALPESLEELIDRSARKAAVTGNGILPLGPFMGEKKQEVTNGTDPLTGTMLVNLRDVGSPDLDYMIDTLRRVVDPSKSPEVVTGKGGTRVQLEARNPNEEVKIDVARGYGMFGVAAQALADVVAHRTLDMMRSGNANPVDIQASIREAKALYNLALEIHEGRLEAAAAMVEPVGFVIRQAVEKGDSSIDLQDPYVQEALIQFEEALNGVRRSFGVGGEGRDAAFERLVMVEILNANNYILDPQHINGAAVLTELSKLQYQYQRLGLQNESVSEQIEAAIEAVAARMEGQHPGFVSLPQVTISGNDRNGPVTISRVVVRGADSAWGDFSNLVSPEEAEGLEPKQVIELQKERERELRRTISGYVEARDKWVEAQTEANIAEYTRIKAAELLKLHGDNLKADRLEAWQLYDAGVQEVNALYDERISTERTRLRKQVKVQADKGVRGHAWELGAAIGRSVGKAVGYKTQSQAQKVLGSLGRAVMTKEEAVVVEGQDYKESIITHDRALSRQEALDHYREQHQPAFGRPDPNLSISKGDPEMLAYEPRALELAEEQAQKVHDTRSARAELNIEFGNRRETEALYPLETRKPLVSDFKVRGRR